jgi:predicted ArsR family transcriptional regulator
MRGMMREEPVTATAEPCLHALSDTQQRILNALNGLGTATAVQVGNALEVTSAAVRPKLNDLVDIGLVASKTERSGNRGRPKNQFRLSPAGHDLLLFHTLLVRPDLDRAVLDELRRRDPKLLAEVTSEVLRRRSDSRSEQTLLAGAS